jgi:branched-chain amino acid transport system ATP-binding protein
LSALLQIDDLKVNYGAVQALRGVSLHVDRGEIVTLLGANGAGKSSLLKSVMGMTFSRSGRISLDGVEIQDRKTEDIVKRGISLAPEGRGILSSLSVMENLELGAFHRKNWRADLENIFNLFPRVQERQNQLAGTLSGGEQQMVAIARALLAKPRLLMLDEPSLGLAPKIIQNIFELISQIRKTGVSILLIEQNVHMALKVSDRAYFLQNGRICMSGSAAEMRERKEETRSAYLGS